MNLKDYYKAISHVEAEIPDEFAFVVSLPTDNGGRGGVVAEVTRATAAKLIVDQQARLTTPAEARQAREDRKEQQRQKEMSALRERMRITRLAEDELRTLKKSLHPTRKAC